MDIKVVCVTYAGLAFFASGVRADEGVSPVAERLRQDIKPFCEREDLAASIPLAERVAAAHPNDVDVSDLLIQLYFGAGRPEDGLRVAKQVEASKADPKSIALILFSRFKYHITIRRHDLAAIDIETMRRMAPDWLQLRYHLARYYVHRDAPAQALVEADCYLNSEPEHFESLVLKAYSLYMLDRFPDALVEIDHAIRVAQDKATGHYVRSLILARMRRFAESGAALHRSLIINSEVSQDVLTMGQGEMK